MKNLINWKELSRILAGNDDSIRRDKIPKKYEEDVEALISALYFWKWKRPKPINDKTIRQSKYKKY